MVNYSESVYSWFKMCVYKNADIPVKLMRSEAWILTRDQHSLYQSCFGQEFPPVKKRFHVLRTNNTKAQHPSLPVGRRHIE